MTDMPDEIWLYEGAPRGVKDWFILNPDLKAKDEFGTKYIRADKHQQALDDIKALREALESITEERLRYDNSCAIGRDGLEYCEDCGAYETKKGNDWVLEHEENCPYIIAVRTLEQTKGIEGE